MHRFMKDLNIASKKLSFLENFLFDWTVDISIFYKIFRSFSFEIFWKETVSKYKIFYAKSLLSRPIKKSKIKSKN